MRKIVAVVLFSCLACAGGQQEVQHEEDSTSSVPQPSAADTTPVVLFLGTSLTAGLGVAQDEAFPALVQQKLDSAGVALRVVNAGESGGTSAGGLRRIVLFLDMHEVRALVLELGANDGLRGLDIESMRTNLRQIIELTRSAHPESAIIIAGMEAPPNLGERYTDEFRQTFVELAQQYSGVLIPFVLEGVGAVPELNQADGIHPNVEGHRVIAETVWKYLLPVVN